MHSNESIIKSFGGDPEATERQRIRCEKAWRAGGQIGNLPLSILLEMAVAKPKKEKPPEFGKTVKAKRLTESQRAKNVKKETVDV